MKFLPRVAIYSNGSIKVGKDRLLRPNVPPVASSAPAEGIRFSGGWGEGTLPDGGYRVGVGDGLVLRYQRCVEAQGRGRKQTVLKVGEDDRLFNLRDDGNVKGTISNPAARLRAVITLVAFRVVRRFSTILISAAMTMAGTRI